MAENTLARNNALGPVPIYGLPYSISYPFLDADGDLVSAATTPDVEISKNDDTFSDCTNESTEIATNSGVWYLNLTGTELTADKVTGQAKSATVGMKTTVFVLYPVKLPKIRSGTGASAGSSTSTIVFDSGASAIDDYYNGCVVASNNDGTVEVRTITDYVGSTKTASVVPDWNLAPDNNDAFDVYATAVWVGRLADLIAILGAAVSTSTAQLGVNVVNNAGSAITSAAGIQEVKVASVAAGALTNAAFAANAISDSKVDPDVTIASVTGAVGSVTGAVGSVTGAVGSVTGAVGSVTAGVTLADDAITAAKIAANAIGSSEIADGALTAAKFASGAFDAVWTVAARTLTSFGSVVADVATAVWSAVTRTLTAGTNIVLAKGVGVTGFNDLSAAQVNAEVDTALGDYDGPTNAELATALGTADDAVLAQVALVKAKTDLIPSDPADASDIASAFSTVNSTLATIAAYIDTEVAAIKAKTDNLPTDPADQSEVAALIASLSSVATAIKAKTDSLTFTKPFELDSNIQSLNGVTLAGSGVLGDEWDSA